tara:strand:+ start:962 stop:1258 length:297 start_codon:yes stop_codon:yes gene_type:complete
MLRFIKKNAVNISLGSFLFGAISLPVYMSVTAPARATEFLENKGYSDISVSHNLFWRGFGTGCDRISTLEFEATNPEGEIERGRICTAPWKTKFGNPL